MEKIGKAYRTKKKLLRQGKHPRPQNVEHVEQSPFANGDF